MAYHLARSVKTRKLALPATLPLCLYPPGAQPDVQGEEMKTGSLSGEGYHGVAAAVGELDGHRAEAGDSEAQGKGFALTSVDEDGRTGGNAEQPIEGTKNKKQTKKQNAKDTKEGESNSVAKSPVETSVEKTKKSKVKGKEKSVAATANSAAVRRSSRSSKSGKVAVKSTKKGSKKGSPQKPGGPVVVKGAGRGTASVVDPSAAPAAKAATEKETTEDGAAFRMSSRERVGHEEEFDKLVGGGNSDKNIGRKEV